MKKLLKMQMVCICLSVVTTHKLKSNTQQTLCNTATGIQSKKTC